LEREFCRRLRSLLQIAGERRVRLLFASQYPTNATSPLAMPRHSDQATLAALPKGRSSSHPRSDRVELLELCVSRHTNQNGWLRKAPYLSLPGKPRLYAASAFRIIMLHGRHVNGGMTMSGCPPARTAIMVLHRSTLGAIDCSSIRARRLRRPRTPRSASIA